MKVKGKFYIKANLASAVSYYWSVNRSWSSVACDAMFFDSRAAADCEAKYIEDHAADGCEVLVLEAVRDLEPA